MTDPLPHRTLLKLTAAALAILALAPAAARAGSYQVSSCDYAGGAQNAWTADSNHAKLPAYTACPSYGDWGRGIIARNAVPASGSLVVPYGAAARQWFTAPPDTGITNVRFSGQIFRAFGQRWNVGLSNGSQILEGASASNTNGWSWTTTDADVPVPGNRTVYWETACYESAGCDTKSTGDVASHYVRAAVWIRGTVVTISDPTYPAAGWGGSLLAGGWLRGDRSLSWNATDNSGIANITATLDGRTLGGGDQPCDYTYPAPCPGSVSSGVTVATTGFADGAHTLRLDTRDASGNLQPLTTTVYTDNTAPARIASVTVDGGEGWRPLNSFRLTWLTPSGQQAPIVRRRYRLCPTDGGACVEGSQDGGQNELVLAVARPGAWRAQVWLEDAAGNTDASNASDPVILRFDDTTPPAAKITAPDGWIGDQAARSLPVDIALADGTSAPPSGIAGWSVTTDGSDPDATIDTDGTWTLTDLPEGDPVLKARAISAAGRPGPITTHTLHVDRSPPAADAAGLPDPGIWQDQPAVVQLTGSDERSGVATVRWQLDGAGQHDEPGDRASVTIADDGRHTLTWETIDHAGNHSRARQAVIRVDRTAPEIVEIRPQDPDHPLQVTATVADRGSGIASGVIQLRPAGGSWRDLDTALDPDAMRLVAMLDDLQLPDGDYQLRAAATDNVGNTRTGRATPITLPLRVASRVTVAMPNVPRAPHTARGRVLTGRVTRADGRAVGARSVTVQTRLRTERSWHTEHTLTTDQDGRFSYRIPTGPSRTIRFTYPGSDTVRPASAEENIRTAAATTIHSSRRHARLGQTITFSGRLRGGHVPADGKVLELQAFDGGRWRSFPQVVRTTPAGTWHTSLRFERTTGTYTYRIRAQIFRDGSYPYETGVSPVVRVTIHGR